MSSIKKIFAVLFAVMAAALMCTAVFAADATPIKYVYFGAGFDLEMQPVNGETIPAPNFNIIKTVPAEAIDAVYIDTSKPLGWYRNGLPCKPDEKFELGQVYTLKMTVEIKSAYKDKYYFYEQHGEGAGISRLATYDKVYAILHDAATIVLEEPYVPVPSETDPPKIADTDIVFTKVVGDEFSLKLSADGYQPIEWSVSGNFPSGFDMDNGKITGTLTDVGKYVFTVKASNKNGDDTKTITINVEDDGNYIRGVYLEGDLSEPELGAKIITPEFTITDIYPPEAKKDFTIYNGDVYWRVCNVESTPPLADNYEKVVTDYFESKKYSFNIDITNLNPEYWDMSKAKIYINGIPISEYGSFGKTTFSHNPGELYYTELVGYIYYNKPDYLPIFIEQPESVEAFQKISVIDASWRTIFKPVKVEIWNNGSVVETITDFGFDIAQLMRRDYTVTRSLSVSFYPYKIRAYWGAGTYDYRDSEEFILRPHRAALISQPTDTMIQSGETYAALGWETNFTPVRIDIYKNGDLNYQITSGITGSSGYIAFEEGEWFLTIYESVGSKQRPAEGVTTDTFIVSKYAAPKITKQPYADDVEYIGGSTSVKIAADNAADYYWLLKDELGYIRTWSYAREQGWCDVSGMSYKTDTLVLDNVSEEMASKHIYCLVYGQSENLPPVTSEWVDLNIKPVIGKVYVTIPGLDKIAAGDDPNDYKTLVVDTEHCAGYLDNEDNVIWYPDGIEVFEAETKYIVIYVLKVSDGYEFGEVTEFYLNGEKAEVGSLGDTYAGLKKTVTVHKADYPKGDINRDGVTDKKDATMVLGFISGTRSLTGEQIKAAKVTVDDELDMLDVVAILNIAEK